MSNGDDRWHIFIERGTDPRLGLGLNAPRNALCTFNGEIYVKTGDDPIQWEAYSSHPGKPQPKSWADFTIDEEHVDQVFFYESDGVTSHIAQLPPFSLSPLGRRYMFVSENNDTAQAGAHFQLRAWNNDVRVNNVANTLANPVPLVGAFAIHIVTRGVSRWTITRQPRD